MKRKVHFPFAFLSFIRNFVPMKLCIFCSANNDIDADFFETTRELGTWAARNGHAIVFGGHDAGLMKAVSHAAKEAGGEVIGVVPKKIEEMGRLSPVLDVHIPCQDLTDRKQLMMQESDAFVVLPGGLGTLDELFTVVAAATLNFHQKPVVLFNMKGFWSSLIACLDDLQAKGVMRGDWHDYIKVVESVEQMRILMTNSL